MNCGNHSNAVGHAGTGRRHACHCTPYGPPSTAPSGPPGDAPVNHYAFTLEAPLFMYRARCDAVTEAGLARTGVISTGLYTIPPHVAK
jgi:hypothetical protein